jgi:hypothetical protein
MVELCLEGDGIKQKLMDAGVIGPMVLHGIGHREVHFDTVIDLSKCWPEKFEEYWQLLKDEGEFEGYTEAENEELKYYPVVFKDGDTMAWQCKWHANEDIAAYASKAVPDVLMVLKVRYPQTDLSREAKYQEVLKDGEFLEGKTLRRELYKLEDKLINTNDFGTMKKLVKDMKIIKDEMRMEWKREQIAKSKGKERATKDER